MVSYKYTMLKKTHITEATKDKKLNLLKLTSQYCAVVLSMTSVSIRIQWFSVYNYLHFHYICVPLTKSIQKLCYNFQNVYFSFIGLSRSFNPRPFWAIKFFSALYTHCVCGGRTSVIVALSERCIPWQLFWRRFCTSSKKGARVRHSGV